MLNVQNGGNILVAKFQIFFVSLEISDFFGGMNGR